MRATAPLTEREGVWLIPQSLTANELTRAVRIGETKQAAQCDGLSLVPQDTNRLFSEPITLRGLILIF